MLTDPPPVTGDLVRRAYAAAALALETQEFATELRRQGTDLLERARDLDVLANQHRRDARELAELAGVDLDEDNLNPCPF